MSNYKKVYVCSPLYAETEEGIRENAKKAKLYMEVVSSTLNCKAVAPHAYLYEILNDNDPAERSLALDFGLKYLSLCDALVIVGDIISSGMKAEIELAKKLKKPIIEAHIDWIEISAIVEGADRFAK